MPIFRQRELRFMLGFGEAKVAHRSGNLARLRSPGDAAADPRRSAPPQPRICRGRIRRGLLRGRISSSARR
jgi:hypothetical protein